MERLARGLNAKAMLVIGVALIVAGLGLLSSPYDAADRYHFMEFSCGSVISPDSSAPHTVNCNRVGHAITDSVLVEAGLLLGVAPLISWWRRRLSVPEPVVVDPSSAG